MNIENIIFDFGGVILDIDPGLTIKEFGKLGVENPEIFERPDFVTNIVRKFERGIFTPEIFRARLRDYLKLDATDQQIDDAWNALLFDIPAERIKVIEEVKKHYSIFLLSNSNEIHYDLYVRDLQLRFGYREFDELFNKAYFSFDLHMCKPNPDIYEFVLYQHNMNPGTTLFVDDKKENINTAKELGLKTLLLEPPLRIRDVFEKGILKDNVSIIE